MKKKAIVAVVAFVLVLCCAIGGTLAWLVDSTSEVKNTFTYGDINIDLSENTGSEYKMIPGNDIAKDPKVTVEANSEACWLFVKVEESDNFDVFMTYAIAEGWTLYNTNATGDGIDTATNDEYVIYREVNAETAKAGNSYQVLKGDKVTVRETVEKSDMEDIRDGDVDEPTLTFIAYAVQKDNLTLEQAYDQAFNAN